MNPVNQKSLFPIVIGVTGHRDVPKDDFEKLEAKVKEVLSTLIASYPDSQFVFLSALAEGSDQIAAKAALNLGMSLAVPIPLPIADYMNDFATDELKKGFKEILAKASTVVETWDTILTKDSNRAFYYARAGAFIAKHSAILLALWDEIPSSLTGGTSEVVRYRTEGIPPELLSSDLAGHASEQGRVIVIRTPRIRHENRIEDAFKVTRIGFREKILKHKALEDLKRLNGLNRKINSMTIDKATLWPLIDQEELNQLKHIENLHSALSQIENQYLAVDALALETQKRTQNALRLVLAFGFLTVIIVHQLNSWHSAYLGAVGLVAGVSAYLIYYREIHKRKFQKQYIDFRALAEALRVQFYWTFTQLPDHVSDKFLRSPSDQGSWIRNVLFCSSYNLPVFPDIASKETIEKVRKIWIEDQRKYFERVFNRQFISNSNYSTLIFIFFLFAALISITPTCILAVGVWKTTKTFPYILVGQLLLGLFAVGQKIFARAVEIRRHKETLGELGIIDEEKINRAIDFWTRPIGVLIACILTVTSLIALIFCTQTLSKNGDQILRLVGFTSVITAVALHIYSDRSAFRENFKRYGRMSFLSAWSSKHVERALERDQIDQARVLVRRYGEEALAETAEWVRLSKSRPVQAPALLESQRV